MRVGPFLELLAVAIAQFNGTYTQPYVSQAGWQRAMLGTVRREHVVNHHA
jgi:hypothetical protein